MTGLSSGPSTEQLRTISDGPAANTSSASSDLSPLSLDQEPMLGDPSNTGQTQASGKIEGAKGKKRARDSSGVDASPVKGKKAKVEEGAQKEVGIYCHQ